MRDSTCHVHLPPLYKARFIERPNRFLIRCRVNGKIVDAHLPDPGRLKELLIPDVKLLIEHTPRIGKKTQYTVHLVNTPTGYVSINTRYPNLLVLQSLQNHCLPGFQDYSLIRSEVPVENHRLDFELKTSSGKQVFMEVKSVTLVERDGIARFPDAVTSRGKSHVELLEKLVKQGIETWVFFVVQRQDSRIFTPHWQRDPDFSSALEKAIQSGVKLAVHSCRISKESIGWHLPIPYDLKDYRYA
jgi:sugar fermentation stimulation protein A